MPTSACCRRSRGSKRCSRAVESNAIALQATESGYEAGTRTAVDVLSSRRQWVQAQTDYSRSRYDYMVNMVKLQQAAGILTEQSLSRLNALLKDEPPKPETPTRRLSAEAPSTSMTGTTPSGGAAMSAAAAGRR